MESIDLTVETDGKFTHEVFHSYKQEKTPVALKLKVTTFTAYQERHSDGGVT